MTRAIEWTGLEHLQRVLTLGGQAAGEAAGAAVYAEAQVAFGDSQVQVPVRDGVLRGSGRIHPPQVEGHTLTVEIAYGGAASAYAEIVHENLEARHAAPTKAKYLEDPVMRRAATLAQNVATRVDQALRSIR